MASGQRVENSASPHDLTNWVLHTPGQRISAWQVARVADAIGDPNPLWSDVDHARARGYRERVAPPTMVDALNPFYAGYPYPVAQEYPYEFSGGDEFILHEPVCVGDVVSLRTTVRDQVDRLRRDGRSRIRVVTYQKDYHNETTGNAAATVLWTYVNFEGESRGRVDADVPEPTEVGWEELPAVVDTLDIVKIVKWAGAVGDYARIHIDYPFATKERGLKDVVGHGPRTTALLGRALTDWVGTRGRVTGLNVNYRASTYPGDRLTTRAWAKSASGNGDRQTWEVRVSLVNQDDVAVTTGTATLETRSGT